MNDFNRCNKVSGIHWLKKPIDSLIIKVQLKPQNGIVLPHFLDFSNESNTTLQQSNEIKEYTFKWQQKLFSAWELQRYADIHNCITDTELNYHDVIKNVYLEHNKVFTYIHDDNYLPTPLNVESVSQNAIVDSLSSCMQRLNLNDKFGTYLNHDTASMGHLFRSEENIADDDDKWITMHVVFDNSEYNEDSQLLLKQEATLLSLYFNTNQNYLIARPDVNNLEWNPYAVETSSGVKWNYNYALRLSFEDEDDGEELEMLLKQLSKKCLKKNKAALDFTMPSIGRKQYFVTLEIVSATKFDAEEMYIEFYVKFPDGVTSNDVHHGRTHITSAVKSEHAHEWNYAHLLELCLEADVGEETLPVQLFFEVISVDWWGRHRTEGYSCFPLPLAPGHCTRSLGCVRPEERDPVEAESRRFFVGGCHLLKDLEILMKPRMQDSNFSYVSTGSINLRWNTLLQCHIPGAYSSPALQQPVSSASALLQGAEAVLKQYKKARARLVAATRDLRGQTSKKLQGYGDC